MTMDHPLASPDDVIEAFLREGRTAEPERVRRWISAHPECRKELLALAARLSTVTLTGVAPPIGDAESAVMRADVVARAREIVAGNKAESFADLIAGSGLEFAVVADRIAIDEVALAEVEAGHVAPPFVPQFVQAAARALERTVEQVAAALAAQEPAPMHAKGGAGLEIGRVSWRELIEGSDMDDERKAFWLEGA